MNCAYVNEDLYSFKHYGKAIITHHHGHHDLVLVSITWCSSFFQQKIENIFVIDSRTNDSIRRSVLQIKHDNWDSFYQVGIKRLMLNFEFCIDTRDAKAVCCRHVPSLGETWRPIFRKFQK